MLWKNSNSHILLMIRNLIISTKSQPSISGITYIPTQVGNGWYTDYLLYFSYVKRHKTSKYPAIQNRLNNVQPLTGILCSSEQQCSSLYIGKEGGIFLHNKKPRRKSIYYVLPLVQGGRYKHIYSCLFGFAFKEL